MKKFVAVVIAIAVFIGGAFYLKSTEITHPDEVKLEQNDYVFEDADRGIALYATYVGDDPDYGGAKYEIRTYDHRDGELCSDHYSYNSEKSAEQFINNWLDENYQK